jgi:lipid-binding SYLF domain-containing protein
MADDIKGTTHLSNVVVEEDITSVGDDLTLTDDLSVGGDATVTGSMTVTGTATVTGNLTAAAAIYGPSNDGVLYPGFSVDGVNPPTIDYLRWYDQTTGAYRVIYLDGGTITVV